MRIYISIISALLVFFASLPSMADKVSQYKPPTQFEVTDDFYVIEGAGLYQTGSLLALSPDMWKNAARADVTQLLRDMPTFAKSAVVRDMIKSILLSESDTQKLKRHKDIKSGEDLLTMRIYKLMEGGFYDEALELYSVAIETPHHLDIAKVGILAMLGAGEKSIACLEMKTLGQIDNEDTFWSTFKAYCDYSLSDTPSDQAKEVLQESEFAVLRSLAFNPSFVFPYNREDFNALSLVEQNVLIAEGAIEKPALTSSFLESMTAKDVSILLSLGSYADDKKAQLMVRGVDLGVLPINALNTFYKSSRGELPDLYQRISNENDVDALDGLLIKVINIQEQHDPIAMVPFARFFGDADIRGMTPEQMKRLLWTLYRADGIISQNMIENYLADSGQYQENEDYFRTLQVISLMSDTPKRHDLSTIMQNLAIFHKNSQNKTLFVIENLDNPLLDDDNAVKVYEKDIDLASQVQQTDADRNLQMALERKAKANSLGETILLSILMLHQRSVAEMNSGLYESSTKALNSVNLKGFSRKMAIERLIGE